MAEVRKKKRRIILIVLCTAIVLAGAGAGVLVWENRVERQFPMWRTPCLEPEEDDIDPNVSLRLWGIDFNGPLTYGELRNVILMKAKAIPISNGSGGPETWVDYWYKGKWHTVWHNDNTTAESISYDFESAVDGEISIKESLPDGLFVRDGQYRLFKDGLGYCDIDITEVERQFPMWFTPCFEPKEQDINPHVSLRFSGIDFEVSNASGHVFDRVLMKAKATSISGCGGGPEAWVDCWYEGEWHTVWDNGNAAAVAITYNFESAVDGEISLRESVPAGLFARDGQYRLFKDGLGYCDIDIIGIDSMK